MEGPFEYYDGSIIRMEASMRHEKIQSSLTFLVYPAVQAKKCEVFGAHAIIEVSARQHSTPDLTIFCEPLQPGENGRKSVRNPCIIFEILSRSTEGMDRGRKSAGYRALPSLQQYVLISQEEPRVEWFERGAGGFWIFHEAVGLDGTLRIPALSADIALSAIYRGIDFERQDDL